MITQNWRCHSSNRLAACRIYAAMQIHSDPDAKELDAFFISQFKANNLKSAGFEARSLSESYKFYPRSA